MAVQNSDTVLHCGFSAFMMITNSVITCLKRHCKVVFALTAIVLLAQPLLAQQTWHFVGPTASDLNDIRFWNSRSDGQGQRAQTFSASDQWLLSSRARVIGEPATHRFDFPLISGGEAEIDPRARLQAPTLTHLQVPVGTLFYSEPRVDGINFLAIEQIELHGVCRLRAHPERPFRVSLRHLIGDGSILVGDSVTGREIGIIQLSVRDGAEFNGVVRLRNTTTQFVHDTDLSRAELFIHQADSQDKNTTFQVANIVTVRELRLQNDRHMRPGQYTAADLNNLLTGQRIVFEDHGGFIVIAP
jgi:hypothetical protein